MQVLVTRDLIDLLQREAALAYPQECCGVLLGKRQRITAIAPARNVHPAPKEHFEIDPRALIDAHRAARKGGPQVLGYYHSHPQGPAEPSTIDRAQAAHGDAIWAIIAGNTIGWWRDAADGFVPLSITGASV